MSDKIKCKECQREIEYNTELHSITYCPHCGSRYIIHRHKGENLIVNEPSMYELTKRTMRATQTIRTIVLIVFWVSVLWGIVSGIMSIQN